MKHNTTCNITLHRSNEYSLSTEMKILQLFIFFLACFLSLGNEAIFIRNGYIYEAKGTMFPTSTVFKLVVTLDKNILSRHLYNLHLTSASVLNYFSNFTSNTIDPPHTIITNTTEEVMSRRGNNPHQLRQLLHQELLTILNHVNLLTQLFTQQEKLNKEKRALLPWVGKLNSFLFGSATDERVNTLQKKISELEGFTSNNLYYLKSHEAALNNTITVVNSLIDNVNKLAQIGSLLQSEKQYISRLADVTRHMSQDSMLLASLSLLNSVVSEVKTQAYRLTDAITQARQSTLSASLLPHNQFLHTLHNISKTHSLFIEPTSDTLPIFYKIADVKLYNNENMFMFEIVLPLKDFFTSPLNLYSAKPYIFPYTLNNTQTIESVYLVLPEAKGLLAVAQSGLNTIIEKGQSNCKSINDDSLIVCFSVPLYTLPASCPASIFLQKYSTQHCSPNIVPQPKTTFYMFGEQHFYVAPNSRRASLSCYPIDGPPTARTIILEHQGFTIIPPLCTLSVDSTLIPAPTSIEGQTKLNLSVPMTDLTINIPKKTAVLISENKNLIKGILNISTTPIHLDKISSHINQFKMVAHIPSAPTTISVSTIVTSIGIIATAIAVYTLFRLRRLRHPVSDLTNKLISLNNHIQKRSRNNTELQTIGREETPLTRETGEQIY